MSQKPLESPFSSKSTAPIRSTKPKANTRYGFDFIFAALKLIWYYIHRKEHMAGSDEDEDDNRYV
jgi:hypothetical protein